jgi:hypothetical protein
MGHSFSRICYYSSPLNEFETSSSLINNAHQQITNNNQSILINNSNNHQNNRKRLSFKLRSLYNHFQNKIKHKNKNRTKDQPCSSSQSDSNSFILENENYLDNESSTRFSPNAFLRRLLNDPKNNNEEFIRKNFPKIIDQILPTVRSIIMKE